MLHPHISLVDSKSPGTAETNTTVLLSAHYDLCGWVRSVRAPDDDDEGSGTIAILARAVGSTDVRFRDNVELVLFAGWNRAFSALRRTRANSRSSALP
jgi:hypothetical protein